MVLYINVLYLFVYLLMKFGLFLESGRVNLGDYWFLFFFRRGEG